MDVGFVRRDRRGHVGHFVIPGRMLVLDDRSCRPGAADPHREVFTCVCKLLTPLGQTESWPTCIAWSSVASSVAHPPSPRRP